MARSKKRRSGPYEDKRPYSGAVEIDWMLARARRLEMGVSAGEIASRVGVSESCIFLYETGRSRPRLEHFRALAKALKLPTRDLKRERRLTP